MSAATPPRVLPARAALRLATVRRGEQSLAATTARLLVVPQPALRAHPYSAARAGGGRQQAQQLGDLLAAGVDRRAVADVHVHERKLHCPDLCVSDPVLSCGVP